MKKTSTLIVVTLAIVLFLQPTVSAQQHYVVDRSFGETCGLSTIPGVTGTNPCEVFKMPDGKYIVAGDAYGTGGQNAFFILMARFNSDGTIDSTFGTNGSMQHTFNQRNTVTCVTMADDKIYFAGVEAPGNGGSSFRAYVARFKSNGTPDTSFNSTGRVVELVSTNPVSSSYYRYLVVQPDGKVVAFGTESGNINGGATVLIARRYNVNGSVDNTFHPSVTYPGFTHFVGNGGYNSPGILEPDGSMRFVYIAETTNYITTVKLDSVGEPVAAYGLNGMNTTSIPISTSNGVNRFFADPQGKMYVQGLHQNTTQDIRVVRLNANGNADSTFSSDGVLDHFDYPATNLSESAHVLHRDSQGRLWSMGAGSFAFTEPKGIIYRFDANAVYDLMLDGTGYMAITEFLYTTFRSAYFESDDEIVINTVTNGELGLLKLGLTTAVVSISNAGADTICVGNQTSLSVNQPTGCYTYHWAKDGSGFANPNDTAITVTTSGTYRVSAIAGNDTAVSGAISITTKVCTFINEAAEQNPFSIYPNPAQDVLNISGSGMANGDYLFTLKNVMGQAVAGQIVTVENKAVQKTLSISELSNGIYFLVIEGKGRRAVVKVNKLN